MSSYVILFLMETIASNTRNANKRRHAILKRNDRRNLAKEAAKKGNTSYIALASNDSDVALDVDFEAVRKYQERITPDGTFNSRLRDRYTSPTRSRDRDKTQRKQRQKYLNKKRKRQRTMDNDDDEDDEDILINLFYIFFFLLLVYLCDYG